MNEINYFASIIFKCCRKKNLNILCGPAPKIGIFLGPKPLKTAHKVKIEKSAYQTTCKLLSFTLEDS